MTQPGESGEHWDQAQPALWAWPSLAGDPGLAGAFRAGASSSRWWWWGCCPQAHPEPTCLNSLTPLVCVVTVLGQVWWHWEKAVGGLGSSTWCGAQGSAPSSPSCLAAGFEFDRWLNTPGWPPYLPDLSPGQELMRPADELAELWAADSLNMEAIEAVDITGWRTYQLVYFLDQVLQKSPLPEGERQVTPRALVPRGDTG